MSDTGFIQHNLHDNDWIGLIINNDDPIFSGRAQVRVFGVMDGIINEHIPWASPVNSGVFGTEGAGSLSIPKIGSFVRIQFNNGDIYAPEMLAIQNIDTDLITKIKDDYIGTHVLLYDASASISIIYQNIAGFMIFFRDSYFQITPDSMITLQHADSASIIQMKGDITNIVTKNEVNIKGASKVTVSANEVIVSGDTKTKIGPGPYNSAILAEPFIALLSVLAGALDAKLPPTPGVNMGMVESFKTSFTSTNVLISK